MSKLSYFLFSKETAERPNLLYFRIFNNKYIEMSLKYIKIMPCPIFKMKNKAKYPQFSLFLHIKRAQYY